MEKMTNRPCLDKKLAENIIKQYCWEHGIESKDLIDLVGQSFIGWYSRSIAASVFVFCKDENNNWCVLASERGEEAADFQGCWNCPCGYLDFDETVKECAARECLEETGISVPIELLSFVGYEDDPVKSNRQNVTFRFAVNLEGHITTDFNFSKEKNEGKEVGEIRWIKIQDICSYKWAFGHEKRINEIFNSYVRYSNLRKIWNKLKSFF